jgi:hypothetical protein
MAKVSECSFVVGGLRQRMSLGEAIERKSGGADFQRNSPATQSNADAMTA